MKQTPTTSRLDTAATKFSGSVVIAQGLAVEGEWWLYLSKGSDVLALQAIYVPSAAVRNLSVRVVNIG